MIFALLLLIGELGAEDILTGLEKNHARFKSRCVSIEAQVLQRVYTSQEVFGEDQRMVTYEKSGRFEWITSTDSRYVYSCGPLGMPEDVMIESFDGTLKHRYYLKNSVVTNVQIGAARPSKVSTPFDTALLALGLAMPEVKDVTLRDKILSMGNEVRQEKHPQFGDCSVLSRSAKRGSGHEDSSLYFALEQGQWVWRGEDVTIFGPSPHDPKEWPNGVYDVMQRKTTLNYANDGIAMVPSSWTVIQVGYMRDNNNKLLTPVKETSRVEGSQVKIAIIDRFPEEKLHRDVPSTAVVADRRKQKRDESSKALTSSAGESQPSSWSRVHVIWIACAIFGSVFACWMWKRRG